MVNIIAWGVLAAVLIGFIERLTKFSWGEFFFEHVPASYIPSIAPGTLSVRGAAVRSQGAAQFALEYGWVLAMLLPLTVAATIRWSHGRESWRKAALWSADRGVRGRGLLGWPQRRDRGGGGDRVVPRIHRG